MTRNHLVAAFANGEILAKQNEYKFSRGKIVRGTFYSYYLGDIKITEAQYEYLKDNFDCKRVESGSLSRNTFQKV